MPYVMVNCVIVDDDQDIADVFSELLNIIGLDVLAKGTNGKDAIKLYKKYLPDLIFVDMIMPKYDGFYAIKNIKDADPNAKVFHERLGIPAKTGGHGRSGIFPMICRDGADGFHVKQPDTGFDRLEKSVCLQECSHHI